MAEGTVSVAGGESRLSRTDGSGEEDYAVLQAVLGLRFKLPILLHSDWQPSLLVEAGYNRVSGNETKTTLGSYRNLVFIEAGYHQPLWKYVFVAIKAGVGVSDNHFNFGEGSIPLPSEIGVPFLLNARLGGEYCFGQSPCINVFAEPFYERNLGGNPDYHDYGAVGGVGFAFDLSPTVSADKYKKMEDDRDAWKKRAEEKPAPEEKKPVVVIVQQPPKPPVVVVQPCPDLPKVPTATEILAQDAVAATVVLFPNESDGIPLFPNSQLDLVVRNLKENPGMGVIIHGHANETGSEKLNERLSLERANKVKRYLERQGVPARQLVETKGHGSLKPIHPRDPKDPMNRAVVFEKVQLK